MIGPLMGRRYCSLVAHMPEGTVSLMPNAFVEEVPQNDKKIWVRQLRIELSEQIV